MWYSVLRGVSLLMLIEICSSFTHYQADLALIIQDEKSPIVTKIAENGSLIVTDRRDWYFSSGSAVVFYLMIVEDLKNPRWNNSLFEGLNHSEHHVKILLATPCFMIFLCDLQYLSSSYLLTGILSFPLQIEPCNEIENVISHCSSGVSC